jgi:hypothetical protein
MPSVLWTLGGYVLEFDEGVEAGQSLKPGQKFVVSKRTAGGTRRSYNLGATTPLVIDSFATPHITAAKKAEIITWIATVCVESLNAFTHTDNSQSPAAERTVFLKDWWFTEEYWPDPASPRFTFHAVLEDD